MFSNKALRALILPLIVEQALAVTIGAADTVMVSSVGEAAVSGISLVDTINILLINIFTALATGGAVVSSQFLGKQDLERARRAAKQLIVAITALALIITVISLAFRPHILRLVFGQIEDDVMENAKTYFLLTALSYPFLALYNGGAALFRSMGNSKISMLTSLVMNIVNICGNAILIFIFNMGVAGAGTATLASRIIGAAIMMFLISRPSPSIYIDSFLRLGFDPGMIKNILRIGVPNGLESGVFQIGKVLVQSLVATFGTSAIAANAVANNIASMEVIPGVAIGNAMITVVGQCVGAKQFDEAKKLTWRLMRYAVASIGILNIFIFLLREPIAGFYNLSPETQELAILLFCYHGICGIFIWPFSFALPNALRGASDVKYTMVVSIVSIFLCRIASSYLLALTFGLGLFGVWIGMTIDWVFRSIFFIARFRSGAWQNKSRL